jgi:hypothetical protein
MHAYKVTIRSPQCSGSYYAMAFNWYECFSQAVIEFGVRAVICVKPI